MTPDINKLLVCPMAADPDVKMDDLVIAFFTPAICLGSILIVYFFITISDYFFTSNTGA